MRKLSEILVDNLEDRYIFVSYNQDGEVEGLNFHQGIGEIDLDFMCSCKKLSTIYRHLDYHKSRCSDEQMRLIKDAIALYLDLYLYN